MNQVIICGARYIEQSVEEQDCPICKGKQKFLLRLEEWHGYTENCLGCGATWLESGEWLVPESKKRRLENLPRYQAVADSLSTPTKDGEG
jgi:hypothetical protein